MQSISIYTHWSSKIAAYCTHSGAPKQRYLTFLEQSGYERKLPQIPIATRWTAMFDAVANYHTDKLAAEKLFLILETDLNE